MSVLLDTGIVYAYYDRSDKWHAPARTVIEKEQRALILPAAVIPEVDWLLGQRLGGPRANGDTQRFAKLWMARVR